MADLYCNTEVAFTCNEEEKKRAQKVFKLTNEFIENDKHGNTSSLAYLLLALGYAVSGNAHSAWEYYDFNEKKFKSAYTANLPDNIWCGYDKQTSGELIYCSPDIYGNCFKMIFNFESEPDTDFIDAVAAGLAISPNGELDYVYKAEDPTTGTYINTDINGDVFTDRFKIVDDDYFDEDEAMYCENEEQVRDDVLYLIKNRKYEDKWPHGNPVSMKGSQIIEIVNRNKHFPLTIHKFTNS